MTSPPIAVPPAIHARGLTLTLGQAEAPVAILNGIDLVVPQGQTLALLGPSGSGKSSLMAVLTGLERASGGALSLAGEDLVAKDEEALARMRRGRVGVVLQAFHLLPTMTALENVMTALELAGQDAGAEDRARAELAAVGLGHRVDHYPAQLSGGEQQRVAIARALAPGPALIFADEPTGNLDARTGAQIIDLLFARRAQSGALAGPASGTALGATLVIITHDQALAERCERVVTLADGRIAADTLAA